MSKETPLYKWNGRKQSIEEIAAHLGCEWAKAYRYAVTLGYQSDKEAGIASKEAPNPVGKIKPIKVNRPHKGEKVPRLIIGAPAGMTDYNEFIQWFEEQEYHG